MRAKLTGAWTQRSSPVAGIGESILDRLLQRIVKETLGGVVRSPFSTKRRSLLHLSQGGKKRAVQLSCAGTFHLGFDNELVAHLSDGALRRQLVKGVPDRLGVRAVDPRLEVEFHVVSCWGKAE